MKAFQGIVKSAKNTNTAIVEVERFHVHPLYEKRVKRTKGYAVHTDSVVAVGDTVRFIQCPPISKTKRWKVVEVVKKPLKTKARKVIEPKKEEVKSETISKQASQRRIKEKRVIKKRGAK
ncbi:MAG: uS17 family ribosomal protein [bacterium]|nr:uS17 family ribosomal protein [bacterium]